MLKKPQALLARAFATAANAIMIADRHGHMVWVNQAFCRLSGYAESELMGKSPDLLRSGQHDTAFYRELWSTILSGRPWQGELIERRKDGAFYTVNQIITPLQDSHGNITHFLAIQHDVSAQRSEQERIARLAYHDSLTGLPNRQYFLELLDKAIAAAALQGNMLAVMFLDLDKFKQVNDTLGHAIGDQLLISVAERLHGAIRKSDVVARLGGDEFTVLISELQHTDHANAVAQQLVDAIGQPFAFGPHKVQTHASIGISLYPRDGVETQALLDQADAAMYHAKRQGGGAYAYWSAAMQAAPPAKPSTGAS
ncbi:diguanylate cyclase domain-containing protein [Chitinimonas sp. JJ19]|uniref:diguanylate cyclase domain-containing protein n=1 Tax=Chitinimonas sp. JJ19 TaxID=3109352 RepID=UPI0030017BD9